MRGSEATSGVTPATGDITDCDREPIHIPGRIQPHGVLLVLDSPDGPVLQVSANSVALLGVPPEAAIGQPLSALLGDALAREIRPALERVSTGFRPLLVGTVTPPSLGRAFHLLAHRNAAGLILELEAETASGTVPELHALVDDFTLAAEAIGNVPDLSRRLAEETRRLTGFDRVLVYRFDEDGHGTVVGEDGNGRLPALLDHRFPASDIPAQARALYRENRLRIIPDVDYRPVPITPEISPRTGLPLDLTFSTLRSVSPVHVMYMRNMGTAASMSVSILRGGTLWGLLSCHHTAPRVISFPIRAACDLLARSFSLRLQTLEQAEEAARRIEVRSAFARLVAELADQGDVAAALSAHPRELLALADASGAAVLTQGGCLRFGLTPDEPAVRALADWLFQTAPSDDVWSTETLSRDYPPAAAYQDCACGVLAAAISKIHPSYLLWFRPEVIRTIPWGGNPHQAASTNGDITPKLHPRTSFATWKETVRDRSRPWTPADREGVAELRNMVVGKVLRKAEEIAALNAELTRSNTELEAFSYSVSHDLRAPLRHIAGYAEMLRESAAGKLDAKEERYVNTIIESSEFAGRLVDKLLNYSRLGRAELQPIRIDLNVLVREVREDVLQDAVGRRIVWQIAALPVVEADVMMLRMALHDLIANAVKYTRDRDPAVIEIGAADDASSVVVFVRDNGVGFDMRYVDKLFGVFQRLHRWEDFEGTGIGLANVRRVIERHGGRTWAEGEPGKGATFSLALPRSLVSSKRGAPC